MTAPDATTGPVSGAPDDLEGDLIAYRSLARLAEAQLDRLAKEDLDGYRRLAEMRDRLMEQIETPRSPEGRRSAATILGRVRELDERAREQVAAAMTGTRTQLAELRQGRRSLRVYGRQAYQPSDGILV